MDRCLVPHPDFGKRAPATGRTTGAQGRWSLGFLTVSSCLLICACGEEDPSGPGNTVDPPELVADSVAVLRVGAIEVALDGRGTLGGARLADGACEGFFLSGLWIAGTVAGSPRANLVWVGDYPWSNFTSAMGDSSFGPFLVTPEHLDNPAIVWPFAHGYPRDEEERPRLYGDAMLWSALRADETVGLDSPVLAAPLPGLVGDLAVFGFDGESLARTLFMRWDLRNAGASDWVDLHLGLYADTDLAFEGNFANTNLTGYDRANGITYTYSSSIPPSAPQWISGFAILATPVTGLAGHGVTAHRIMWKNYHPEYGEDGFTSAQQVLWTLLGLTKLGDPVIDPVTGEPTSFALDGDPVLGEGWLDSPPRDVRGLIASGPFTLPPGAEATFIGVWCLTHGDSLADALATLRTDVARARSTLSGI